MGRLILSAVVEDTIASPGNREPLFIVLSVTDINGQAVLGIAAANITLSARIVGPGGADVQITNIYPGGPPPGFYQIHVVPIRTETWKRGVYVFAIVLEKGVDRGQTLASVVMD
jgi:hypothetical protein